jgi:hypothetical protein
VERKLAGVPALQRPSAVLDAYNILPAVVRLLVPLVPHRAVAAAFAA